MNLSADLEEFVTDHRAHGRLTGDAPQPAWNGYLLTVACPCGLTFERWVTPQDAAVDLLRADLRAALELKTPARFESWQVGSSPHVPRKTPL